MSLVQQILDKLEVGDSDRNRSQTDLLKQITGSLPNKIGYNSTRKQLWAHRGMSGHPPGWEPEEYWEFWLEHGASGTCYSTTLALDWLFNELGFEATIDGWNLIGGSSSVELEHMTNAIVLGGVKYVVESSIKAPTPMAIPGVGGAGSFAGCITMCNVEGVISAFTPRVAVTKIKGYEMAKENVSINDLRSSYVDSMMLQAAHQK